MNIQLKLICFFGFIGTIFSGLKIGMERQGLNWSNVWHASHDAQLDILLCCAFFMVMMAISFLVILKWVGEFFDKHGEDF